MIAALFGIAPNAQGQCQYCDTVGFPLCVDVHQSHPFGKTTCFYSAGQQACFLGGATCHHPCVETMTCGPFQQGVIQVQVEELTVEDLDIIPEIELRTEGD
jgi:hypothetical protein